MTKVNRCRVYDCMYNNDGDCTLEEIVIYPSGKCDNCRKEKIASVR